ncbi:sensor histidine kinase [Rhodohalobacter halophilus]|uniref:sensor histidine kinase n=1 Tax=Rhodohalobacter halophilus TaxID=1812810 RepID=UPI00083F5F3A|nr:sensor histidine kinase [Rhodohalobacter halophilus]
MNYPLQKLIITHLTCLCIIILLLPVSVSYGQSKTDTTWTFEQIRTDADNDWIPDFLGENVTVTGIANSASGLFHEQYLQVFIQNNSSGISIFSYNIEEPIAPGDSLFVWGKIDTYNGLVEVDADSYRVFQTRKHLQPLHLNDAIDEPAKFLGVLVEGQGIITEKGSTFNGKYVTISPEDHSGSMMIYVSNFHFMFSDFKFDLLNVGDEIGVRGIITEYNPEVPDEKNYKLFLRTPDDLNYVGLPAYYLRLIFWSLLGIAVLSLIIYLFQRYRVQTETKEIKLSLKQKELLLKEIHHRVKNSLSIVSGLLEMQSYSTENEKTIRILQNSQSRIQSIALIHDKLYKTESLSEIQLDIYIRDLAESIHSTFAEINKKVTLTFDLDRVYIDSKRVIYCGLLVNELVVNSFKHAFRLQGDKTGVLTISLKNEGSHFLLTISDNGPGLPSNFNPDESNGLGAMLISTFAENLKAELSVSSPTGGGTSYTFTIPHKA